MRIGTYNLKFLFDEGTRLHSGKECVFSADFVRKRFAYFAKQFDELNADILFLQELGDESALKKILMQTKEAYSYFVAHPDTYGVGNAVISKKGLQCVCHSAPTNARLPVFNEHDEDILGPRMWSRRDFVVLETTYMGRQLVLFGVHIKSRFLMYKCGASFTESPESLTQVDTADAIIRSEMFRLSQAKKIRELVDDVFRNNEDPQVAVLGDFNAMEHSDMLHIIMGKMRERGDALVYAFGSGTVDHILISKPLENHIIARSTFTESVMHGGPESVGSDHAPLVIVLK